tara:strand:- start:899 stop:3481 length:2583 start_codon:yes stop_codon:yes gene_type:complete
MAIKVWGYGDVGTGDSKYVTGAYTHIEGIDRNDNVVPSDVNRVYRNIYEETYEIFSFLEELTNKASTEGVFKGSLTSAFAFDGDTYKDVTTVTLDATVVHYARLAPGIAFSNGYIVVNKPATHIAERQLAEIFSLEVDGSESVDITYDYAGDSYSAIIVRKNVTGDSVAYTFNNSGAGHDSAAGLLEEIYNDGTFIVEFSAAIGADLTKITLEPISAITDGNTYYWNIQNDGTIALETSAAAGDSELGLANFTIGVADDVVGASSISDNRVFVQNINDFTNVINLNVPSSWGDSDSSDLATAPFDQVTNQNITINMLLQNDGADDKVTFAWQADTVSGLVSSLDGGDTYKNEVVYLNKDLIVRYTSNLIDRPDCEDVTPPMIFDETAPNGYNYIWAQSGDTFYGDTNSYKFTKDVASGSGAVVSLDDQHTDVTNDMHGLIAGNTYTFSAWIWIPSSGAPLGSEIKLNIDDYAASWGESAATATNDYDQWQYITITRTIRAAATGITLYFFIASAAEDTEYFYVDSIKLEETSGWLQLSSLGTYHKNTGDHKDDIIQDRHIDWGTGDSQINALVMPLGDTVESIPTGGTTSTIKGDSFVHAALEEVFTRLKDASGIQNDSIDSRHYVPDSIDSDFINWGISVPEGQISGQDIPIADSEGYYGSTDVEFALEEIYEYTRDTTFMPIGTIIMFDANNTSGSGGQSGAWTDNSTLPGWYACIAGNTAAQSCPNLVDTFIMGKVVAGGAATGGANSITLTTTELPAHDHGTNTGGISVTHTHDTVMGSHTHTFYTYGVSGSHVRINYGVGTYRTDIVALDPTDLGTKTSGGVSVDHTHTIASEGSGSAFDNRPLWYSVIFIRKCA